MLEEHVDFKRLLAEDPRCSLLIPEIASRAQGVWLWVFFVVKDLIHDIEGKEDYDLLKQRLDVVPGKLEESFERIMDRIDNHLGTLIRQAAEDFDPTILLCRITFALLRYGTDWSLASERTWDHFDSSQSLLVVSLILRFAYYAHVLEGSGKAKTMFIHIEALGGILMRLFKSEKLHW
jgi:hypothetical protein